MANYVITINVDAARRESVEKKLKLAFGADIPVHTIEKVKTAESRADRFSDAEGMADQARQIVEELKDEMEQWYDSIPDNLKNGDKANEVEACKDSLDELQGNLENLDWSAEFPGMY